MPASLETFYGEMTKISSRHTADVDTFVKMSKVPNTVNPFNQTRLQNITTSIMGHVQKAALLNETTVSVYVWLYVSRD